MRRQGRAAIRYERLVSAVTSVLAGIGALFTAGLVLSAAAALCDLPERVISAMSGIALAAGCFACSYCAANRRRRGGIVTGVICGAGVFITAFIIGLITVSIFSIQGVIIKLVIILSASAIGGIKGVNARPIFRQP